MSDDAPRDVKQEEVYTLVVPVELKNKEGDVVETITELTFKRLQGKAARQLLNAKDRGTGEFIASLICSSARITPSTFDKLDAQDIFAASEIAGDFFGVSQTT